MAVTAVTPLLRANPPGLTTVTPLPAGCQLAPTKIPRPPPRRQPPRLSRGSGPRGTEPVGVGQPPSQRSVGTARAASGQCRPGPGAQRPDQCPSAQTPAPHNGSTV